MQGSVLVSGLCAFSVFFVSQWWVLLLQIIHHRDTENTEEAQRKAQIQTLPYATRQFDGGLRPTALAMDVTNVSGSIGLARCI